MRRTSVRPVLALLSLLGLMVFHGSAAGQTGGLDHSPAEIVKKYFQLDQKGARLDSLSFEAIAPFIDWRDEPTWGRIVVIRGFTVAEHYTQWDIVDRLEVVVPVAFQIIGSVYLETAGFVPEAGTEEVRVRVRSVKNRWRIIEPVLPPHVGQKRMLNLVREAWVKEGEQDKRDRLAGLEDELRKVK